MHVIVISVQLPSNGSLQGVGDSGDGFRVVVEYHFEFLGTAGSLELRVWSSNSTAKS